jgi:hypothetical protein
VNELKKQLLELLGVIGCWDIGYWNKYISEATLSWTSL